MTAPSIAANDSTTAGLWAFDSSNKWVSRYGACSNKAARTAPLNIDTNKVVPCAALCRLSVNYKPSKCSISMVNNIPTVIFTPTCIIKFNNEFLYLRKMTIHYTSMHTMNDTYSDLEVLLYHNRNPVNDKDGGIILSVLFKSGIDYGSANEFFNEFINKMPSNEMPIEQDIDVSDTWCPDQLFPESSKSFFFYNGALPYPPCTPNWTMIIFEEIVPISQNIIDTVKSILGSGNTNVRPVQRTPKGITISYNPNSQFDGSQDVSEKAVDAATLPIATVQPINALGSVSWLKKNIYVIKGVVITIILILMIYVSIKFAKVIVENDLLNAFIIRQLRKKQGLAAAKSQEDMAAQQAAEYGGVAPVAAPSNNNNNNNNNNND